MSSLIFLYPHWLGLLVPLLLLAAWRGCAKTNGD